MLVSPSDRKAVGARRGLTLLLVFSLLAAALPSAFQGQLVMAQGAQIANAPSPATGKAQHGDVAEFVPGEVLVRFRSDAAAKRAETTEAVALRSFDGQEIVARVTHFGGSNLVEGLRLAEVDPDQTLAAVAAFNARPDVLYAEPNYIWRKTALPNDPRFGEMYGLRNTGQSFASFSGGTPGADIKAEQAWNITTGSHNVVVGVIDEGIDINHPDLAANIWTNPGEIPNNGIDDDGNGYIDDANGWDFFNNDKTVFDGASDDHGTHVAGTIGAVGHNGVGVTGINWNVKLMSLKFLGPQSGTTLGAVSAIDYAVTMKNRGVNIRALNNSWGGGGFSQSLLDAISRAHDVGILFVAAAGNSGTNNDDFPHYPSGYNAPNVIAVARTNHFDNVSQTSSFGARTVHVGAPGTSILSTTPNNNYSFYSGTSMATPHVTGVAALLLAQYPNISLRHLRASLLYSGDPIAGIAGRTINDRRLDAYQALLQAAVEDTTPPALTGLRVTAQSGRRVTVQFTAGDDGTSGTPALYQVTFTAASGAQFGVGSFVPGKLADPNILTFDLPYKQTSGTVTLKVADEDGNEAAASIGVTISAEASEPYTVAVSDPAPLSTGGSPLALTGDDRLLRDHLLPPGFNFPFFGQNYDRVSISTNGTLYFSPPRGTNTNFNASTDAGSSTTQLNLQTMIAGLWDDIDINPGVRPDSSVFFEPRGDSLIFRWQGVRFQVNTPINAEIELRRDGTIITRYGDGNANLNAVVGISGGQSDTLTGPQTDAYVVGSHTGNPITLANAQAVIFTPRVTTVQPPVVSFSTPSISVGEGSSASATLTVTRSGDLSGTTSVNYLTVDNPAEVRCDDTTTAPGVAFARCDYATSVDTITFAPGQDAQQIQIPLIDDGHIEPNETFAVSLNNPTGGATLGVASSITVTITDNDVAGAANPVNTTAFFVRQHYLDFLSREPEAGEPWSAILNGCPNPFNLDPQSASASCDRLQVSFSFFGSPEFRLKGFYVFIHYRVAFDRLAEYSEIVADMRAVTGTTPSDTSARRAAFPVSFTGRAEFRNRYDALSNEAFVNALLDRYGLPAITTPDPANPEGGVKVALTRADLTNRLSSGLTRGQVLRAIVESDEMSAAEYNRAFVAMQYYGYLRRTPEPGGYQSWLNYLRDHPNDSRTMVDGFMNSQEYKLRFGQP